MFKPRRRSPDSTAMIDSAIGRNGPSARPMSMRAASSVMNDPAMPERKEHTENASTQAIRKGLRMPLRSDAAPNA
jgi:hypothetical protein